LLSSYWLCRRFGSCANPRRSGWAGILGGLLRLHREAQDAWEPATHREESNTLTQTDCQHTNNIVPAAGIYDCDCNAFVSYVLSIMAPCHRTGNERDAPIVYEYFDFFASRTPDSSGGWRRIDLLTDARRGDIMAWRFATIEPQENTGHVVIIAETPTLAMAPTRSTAALTRSIVRSGRCQPRPRAKVSPQRSATSVEDVDQNFPGTFVGDQMVALAPSVNRAPPIRLA
jgi:hypothetical protein